MAALDNLLKFIPFKRKPTAGGVSQTTTFDSNSSDRPLAKPTNRDHLEDVFTTRQANDSQQLIKALFKNDPDVSAAVNAFITVSNTTPHWIVKDKDGLIDREGHKALQVIMKSLFTRTDYSKPSPFEYRPSMTELFNEMRHMVLLRGAIAHELLVDKTLLPTGIRQIDASTLEWTERTPGTYTIEQVIGSDRISLDTPSFFVNFFRRDPTSVYSNSMFVSSINTIAARQQVINDLYRIMNKTGYPRIAVEMVEEVLRKNMPANVKGDPNTENTWLQARMNDMSGIISNIGTDQALVHSDSVRPYVYNDKNPGAQLDISKIIEVLNDSNQAALKVMSTIIGRGDKGVNTASVEARIFAMNADQLNIPIASFMSQALTFALRLHGIENHVEFGFAPSEMRPALELEPQKLAKTSRLTTLLSQGLITDDEFHYEMFNRIRPDDVPELSGTGFAASASQFDPSDASSNADPLGRSLGTKKGSSGKDKK